MRDRVRVRFENFDLEGMTRRNVARVGRAAIAAGASRQSTKQINFCEKLDEVSRPHGARLHEILVRVLREASAHEDVEYIMNVMLDGAWRVPQLCREGTRQIGVAAPIVIAAAQQSLRIGVAARANDVVNPRAVLVPAVPAKRIMADRRHGPEMGHGAPQPIASADVSRMERTRFPAEKAFREIV